MVRIFKDSEVRRKHLNIKNILKIKYQQPIKYVEQQMHWIELGYLIVRVGLNPYTPIILTRKCEVLEINPLGQVALHD